MIRKSIQSALAVSLGVAAFTATIPAAYAQAQSAGLEEVFVTARKRDEGAQAVPIAMTAMSADLLEERGIREVQDLNLTVPGFRFGAEGGKGNSVATLRGLSKIPIGDGVPSVVTYFANVALPGRGGNIPMFDVANVQVLKGPQGTLFGRNTLGGAIVIAPVAPTYDLNGYIKGAYGTKDMRVGEGAINLPIVEDKVALRIGGQVRRQDGLNKNLSGGPDFDDTHQNGYRVSLLLNPTDNIENLTVYDHMSAKEQAGMGKITRLNPSVAGLELGLNAAIPGLGTTIAQQLTQQAAQSQRNDFWSGYSDLPGGGFVNRTLWGVSNDTTFDMGWATFRNIFGYRSVKVAEEITSAANDYINFELAPGVTAPFTVFKAAQVLERKVISDEVQLFGTALDDRLDWITGYYFNKDEPNGPNGTNFTSFNLEGVFPPNTPVTGHSTYYNWAVFAQTGFDLSDWVVDGLKLNAGVRYSKDKQSICGGPNADVMSPNECDALAAAGTFGVGTAKISGDEVSWTVGADWQITPDTMVYVTHRRGYRAGILNTPVFNTPFTTGGAGCVSPAVGPTDCPNLSAYQSTEPEEIQDIEIGVKNDWYIGDVKGRINAAAFYMTYDNAVQFLNTQNAGIPSGYDPSSGSVGYNAADLVIQGVEADLTVIPHPSLTLTLSGAYIDQNVDEMKDITPTGGVVAQPTEQEVTLVSPRFSGTFAFSWMLPFTPMDGELAFSGDYYYTKDFGGQNGENLPGYELTNFRLAWTDIAQSGFDVAAYVKNAFEEEYFISPIVFLPGFPVSSAMVGERRTWGVEATYKF